MSYAVLAAGSDEPQESRARWGSSGADGRCHGNQFWD